MCIFRLILAFWGNSPHFVLLNYALKYLWSCITGFYPMRITEHFFLSFNLIKASRSSLVYLYLGDVQRFLFYWRNEWEKFTENDQIGNNPPVFYLDVIIIKLWYKFRNWFFFYLWTLFWGNSNWAEWTVIMINYVTNWRTIWSLQLSKEKRWIDRTKMYWLSTYPDQGLFYGSYNYTRSN